MPPPDAWNFLFESSMLPPETGGEDGVVILLLRSCLLRSWKIKMKLLPARWDHSGEKTGVMQSPIFLVQSGSVVCWHFNSNVFLPAATKLSC